MQYASPGSWECWEARTYLYLDVALGREITDRNDLYSSQTWEEVVEKLTNLPEEEFAERSASTGWIEESNLVRRWMRKKIRK